MLFVTAGFALGQDFGIENKPSIEIHVDGSIIQRIAELASPIRLKGVQKSPVGNVPWVAIITNPAINFSNEAVTFVADCQVEVAANAGPIKVPIKMRQQLTGKLEPHYLKKKNRIIIKPVDVILKSNPKDQTGQVLGMLDLNGMIPDFEIPVYLPRPQFKINKKTIKIAIDPKFEFVESGLRITTAVEFLGKQKK